MKLQNLLIYERFQNHHAFQLVIVLYQQEMIEATISKTLNSLLFNKILIRFNQKIKISYQDKFKS